MGKRIISLTAAVFSLLSLSGCSGSANIVPDRNEINQFQIVQVVGIDKSGDGSSNVEVTFASQSMKSSSGGGSGGGQKSVFMLYSRGSTIFEAERKNRSAAEKKVFFGDSDYFLIGEEAAKDNFSKYFDFITRDHEIRFSPKVYIVRGSSARELIGETSTGEQFIADSLKNIQYDIDIFSDFSEVKIIDVINMLDNTDSATVIPALSYRPTEDKTVIGGETPKMEFRKSGYAVIKDFKLVGYIDETIARGYNFLVSKVKSSPVVVVDTSSGQKVSLEVLNADTNIEARFEGSELKSVTYKTHISSNLAEQQTREKIQTQDVVDDLNAKQSELIKSEMEKVIKMTKVFGVDCLQLGDNLRVKYPLKWEKIKDKWKDIYPNLEINVEVDSDIERFYDIREPNGAKAGD